MLAPKTIVLAVALLVAAAAPVRAGFFNDLREAVDLAKQQDKAVNDAQSGNAGQAGASDKGGASPAREKPNGKGKAKAKEPKSQKK